MMLNEQISQWLKDYMVNAGASGYVVGLSGGIDSTVAAKLAVDGVGNHNVLGVHMPLKGTLDPSYRLALKADHWLDIICTFYIMELALKPMLDMFGRKSTKLVRGNLLARLRMSTLYMEANHNNHLVLGTGNRTEFELGYFTKYGDGGVDVLPLGDLRKQEVYKLAKELGVPQEIIDAPPSAGLWEGQTDEGEFGFTYEQADDLLDTVGADWKGAACGMSRETVDRIQERRRQNKHKLMPTPIYYKHLEGHPK